MTPRTLASDATVNVLGINTSFRFCVRRRGLAFVFNSLAEGRARGGEGCIGRTFPFSWNRMPGCVGLLELYKGRASGEG